LLGKTEAIGSSFKSRGADACHGTKVGGAAAVLGHIHVQTPYVIHNMTSSEKFYASCFLLLYGMSRWNNWLCMNNAKAGAFVVRSTKRTIISSDTRTLVIFSTNDAAIPSTPALEIPIYSGPLFEPYVADDDDDVDAVSPMEGILELTELGLDIAIGPSTIVPGQFGLYCRCIHSVDSVTLPECTLLCGYAKPGTFLDTDVGDKTVGFVLQSGTTAIFFERQLMTVQDALSKAATEYGNGSCGLAGHELSLSEKDESILLQPVANGYKRYFCPNEEKVDPIPIQNYGQYCNDLAWNQLSPPSNSDEYMEKSRIHNCVQLVWRLEYDSATQCLVPTWPVSVTTHDVRFENHNFMELGTRYGWKYWQAIVNLEDLA
jgi:hypothetical protein